jgi:hypothetical protein
MTVVITWMDGQQETHRCYDTSVREGVLWLLQRMHSGEPVRHFPIANIRTWTTEDR